ncbi:MAG: ion channel [bacterium]|nr:ion channel [bacterium]
MKKKQWISVLLMLGCYGAALRLLVFVESFSPEATITTVGEAAWFSLVTLTTAGYGDYYPVTVLGRIIGVIFLLLSTGLLALLIGAAVSLMMGRLLPWLQLRRRRRRVWYVFDRETPEAAALAENLTAEQPGAIAVFCSGKADSDSVLHLSRNCFRLAGDFTDIPKIKGNLSGCTLLVMGPDSLSNYNRALEAVSLGAKVCCQTLFMPDHVPENLILFNRWDCCARLYWQRYPLKKEEKKVLLIGGGRYGSALLEQALTVNVCGNDRVAVYHVFGDEDFLRRHPYLKEVLKVKAPGSGQDGVLGSLEALEKRGMQGSLEALEKSGMQESPEALEKSGTQGSREALEKIGMQGSLEALESVDSQDGCVASDGDEVWFHAENWETDAALLAGADRIIFCFDREEENLEAYRVLCRYFAAKGAVWLRLSCPSEGMNVFGTDREIFTGDLVLRTKQDEAARAMHEIYRKSAGGNVSRWEELGEFARSSNRSAADHLLTKVRFLLEDGGIPALTAENCKAAYQRYLDTKEEKCYLYREIEHFRWMRFYALWGWQYAPVRDNILRLHPDIRPFDRLTPEEQAKDDYAWELLGALAAYWEDRQKEKEKT